MLDKTVNALKRDREESDDDIAFLLEFQRINRKKMQLVRPSNTVSTQGYGAKKFFDWNAEEGYVNTLLANLKVARFYNFCSEECVRRTGHPLRASTIKSIFTSVGQVRLDQICDGSIMPGDVSIPSQLAGVSDAQYARAREEQMRREASSPEKRTNARCALDKAVWVGCGVVVSCVDFHDLNTCYVCIRYHGV